VGKEATLQFLLSMETELRRYVPKVKRFFTDNGAAMPTSSRLALEAGVLGYEARLQWVTHAISVYRKELLK
jgi:hypothetical protein